MNGIEMVKHLPDVDSPVAEDDDVPAAEGGGREANSESVISSSEEDEESIVNWPNCTKFYKL